MSFDICDKLHILKKGGVFKVSKELKRIEETLEHVVFALLLFKNGLTHQLSQILITLGPFSVDQLLDWSPPFVRLF